MSFTLKFYHPAWRFFPAEVPAVWINWCLANVFLHLTFMGHESHCWGM